ncbi:hypothetical protein CSOJ01_12201 [Colletotrichum sojae]|uniref:Cyanovirin-N domain-containing protein n=1 Tax=Colletotrichum sojae TaxID=2175907 RepID=A0A8H6IVG3_9PEZI|nr:hypothetical protein CSOJ01_12201 [Colletotrichum sojae]
MVKSIITVTIGLLAALASANPVAPAVTPSPLAEVATPEISDPAEGLALPNLVLYPPGYDKTAAEGDLEARGFAGTCEGCILINNGNGGLNIGCDCKTIGGGVRYSSYDLNRCIGNSNGQLVWWTNGGWSGSCWNVRFTLNTLYAECRQINGGSRDSHTSIYRTGTAPLAATSKRRRNGFPRMCPGIKATVSIMGTFTGSDERGVVAVLLEDRAGNCDVILPETPVVAPLEGTDAEAVDAPGLGVIRTEVEDVRVEPVDEDWVVESPELVELLAEEGLDEGETELDDVEVGLNVVVDDCCPEDVVLPIEVVVVEWLLEVELAAVVDVDGEVTPLVGVLCVVVEVELDWLLLLLLLLLDKELLPDEIPGEELLVDDKLLLLLLLLVVVDCGGCGSYRYTLNSPKPSLPHCAPASPPQHDVQVPWLYSKPIVGTFEQKQLPAFRNA